MRASQQPSNDGSDKSSQESTFATREVSLIWYWHEHLLLIYASVESDDWIEEHTICGCDESFSRPKYTHLMNIILEHCYSNMIIIFGVFMKEPSHLLSSMVIFLYPTCLLNISLVVEKKKKIDHEMDVLLLFLSNGWTQYTTITGSLTTKANTLNISIIITFFLYSLLNIILFIVRGCPNWSKILAPPMLPLMKILSLVKASEIIR